MPKFIDIDTFKKKKCYKILRANLCVFFTIIKNAFIKKKAKAKKIRILKCFP